MSLALWVRQLKRKTTRNVAVQIVRHVPGPPRIKIVCPRGSAPEGEALQALVDVATMERYRLQEQAQPSLFPAEASANEILAARRTSRGSWKTPGPSPTGSPR